MLGGRLGLYVSSGEWVSLPPLPVDANDTASDF